MVGHPSDVRRRVMGWQAAERREQVLRRQEGPMGPEAALHAALELWEFLPDGAERLDSLRTRDVEEARAAWRRLRVRMACRPADPTHL